MSIAYITTLDLEPEIEQVPRGALASLSTCFMPLLAPVPTCTYIVRVSIDDEVRAIISGQITLEILFGKELATDKQIDGLRLCIQNTTDGLVLIQHFFLARDDVQPPLDAYCAAGASSIVDCTRRVYTKLCQRSPSLSKTVMLYLK